MEHLLRDVKDSTISTLHTRASVLHAGQAHSHFEPTKSYAQQRNCFQLRSSKAPLTAAFLCKPTNHCSDRRNSDSPRPSTPRVPPQPDPSR